MPNQSKAIVNIKDSENKHNNFKRLSLFFDEIYYILPNTILLNNEFLEELKRGEKTNLQETLQIPFFRDVYRGIHCQVPGKIDAPIRQ
jgi:hypothetical protein